MDKIDDGQGFRLAITAMAVTFRREITEALFEGYWLGLRDLTLDAVRDAVTRALRECRFIPSVAELRELAGVVSPEDRRVKAWQVVRRAIYRFGYYTSVDFDDPLTNATIRNMGGWPALQERHEKEDEQWIRKDFDRIYSSLARSGISEEMAAPLMGVSEHSKRLYGRLDLVREPERIACGLPGVVVRLPAPAVAGLADRVALLPSD